MIKNIKLLLLALLGFCIQPLYAEEEVDTTKHDPAEYLSNTLPVLYINTVNETPIVDKENYIDGNYYLDANGCGDYESIGTMDEPRPLKIKGRGNTTWQHPKKPYRLKLENKASLLGMPKSKHWVLLAAYKGGWAHGRDYLSFKISEKMGLPYTPRCYPIEVVLNGDYIGMYFLTEHIRVDKDRVNITEQADGETDPLAVTGGWLLEIDNYREANQIRFIDYKKDSTTLNVTYHSPEILSEEQLSYLTNFIQNVHTAVNTDDKTSTEWELYIDVDALAQYYVVQEAIDNIWAFSGSCWFSKDRGESTKLVWGPLWDNSSALTNRNLHPEQIDFLFHEPVPTAHNHWIGEIAKFPNFQIALRKWWKIYRDEVFPTMQAETDAYEALISPSLASDYLRWGDIHDTRIHTQLQSFITSLTNKYNFLVSHWDDPQEGITLAQMMEEGFDGSEYIINDNLAVVDATENGGRVFVTDGYNHWLQVHAGDYYDNLVQNSSIGTLRGILTSKDFIPTLTLTAEPEVNDADLTVTPKSYNLSEDFNPVVNEVINVIGSYDGSNSTLQPNAGLGDDFPGISLDTSWISSWTVPNGKTCEINGVVQIKEPWMSSQLPALLSFQYPYQNYIIYPTEVFTSTAINNIVDNIEGDTIVNVANMQGQLIKQGVKMSEATQGMQTGIYLIGNKKVVIRR